MNDLTEKEVTLFNAALQLPEAERARYLEETCSGDNSLRARVEALLQAHLNAGGFLEEPPEGGRSLLAGIEAVVAPVRVGGSPEPGQWIGRYKLLRQIGEGGCGIVYLAEQQEPVRRRVAVKLLKLGMDTRQVIGRFEAERQALAMMDYPNIAKVLDAGATETGRPYFVMELVAGEKITDYCNRAKLSLNQRLELFIQTCRAIQHAHQKGIIHRDIKPSNILVTVVDNAPIPKVIDFGIAKATQGKLVDQTFFTALEQFLGTPAYMSPEQAQFSAVDVDTRSDIYSLGVLLYELLTGQTPFDQKQLLAEGLEEMRRIIRQKEPARPSSRLAEMNPAQQDTVAAQRHTDPGRLVHQVRGDLDWIVMKCLEKDRARRYETANGLALDVGRYLAGEPILARPPSRLYQLRKLVGRNRLACATVAVVAAALLGGFAFSNWQYLEKSKAEHEAQRLRQAAQEAQERERQSRQFAQQQERAARKKAYASDMNLLQEALAEDNLARAQELLNRQRPQPGQEDLRGWEWRYFWQFCQSDVAFNLCRRPDSIVSVSFSGDGTMLAVGTLAGEITVWDLAQRRLLFQKSSASGGSGRLEFAPDSNLLAYSDVSGSKPLVVLWDSATRAEVRRLELSDQLRDLLFLKDGRLITADLARSNNVVIWDVSTGQPLRRLTQVVPLYVSGNLMAGTEDGIELGAVPRSAPRSIVVSDLKAGTNFSISVAEELTTALAFAPQVGLLCTGAGYAESAIKLWSLRTGRQSGRLEGHHSWISRLKVLQDHRTLASASADRTVRLWDLETRRPLRTLRGTTAELWTLDVSRDGRWLAAGAKNGLVCLWDLASASHLPELKRTFRPAYWPHSPSYSPDGKWFCLLNEDRLELYDSRTFQPLNQSMELIRNTSSYNFSPDMRLLAAASSDGPFAVWEMPSRRLLTNCLADARGTMLEGPGFLAEGIITASDDGWLREWNTTNWAKMKEWPRAIGGQLCAVSPAARLAAACDGKLIELIHLDHPELSKTVGGSDRIVDIVFSPDGGKLAAASENGTIELWDPHTAQRLAVLHGALLGYHSVTFSPDGQRIAAGSNGREAIKLFDAQSQEEVATLAGQGSFFLHTLFSPDGNTLSAINWNGLIHLWTAPSWQQIEAMEKTPPTGSP